MVASANLSKGKAISSIITVVPMLLIFPTEGNMPFLNSHSLLYSQAWVKNCG